MELATSSHARGKLGKPERLPPYVLVTPARNEERFIERTITAVVGQSVLPVKWVIVSDGSTDGTSSIVQEYASKYAWIKLLQLGQRADRNFAGKVNAFNAGYAALQEVSHEIVASLDADVSFDQDYFSFLLSKFAADPKLGVAGTPFREGSKQYDYRFASLEHVSGACQLFRRECFQDIGGYVPIRGGGVDWVAVTTARMKGWTTQTFLEKTSQHHRTIGTGGGNRLRALFRFGVQDYYLGSHPLWQLGRGIYHLKSAPPLLGGLLLILGYTWGFISRIPRPITRELVEFRRREQKGRLMKLFRRFIGSMP
jgi:poly-beta-1,6-N-acetyl-D-glucosamine synthase